MANRDVNIMNQICKLIWWVMRLESFRLHDARHSHATILLRQGVQSKIVQERLGHAKVGTTLDIYSHVTAGMQQAAALQFDQAMINARQTEPSPA